MVCSVVWRSGPAIRLTVTSASPGPAVRDCTRASGYGAAASIMAGTEKSRLAAIRCRSGSGMSGRASRRRHSVNASACLPIQNAHSRLLIGCAPGVNLCEVSEDKEVLVGKWDFGGALGKQVTEPVALLDATPKGDGMQRLGAGRSKLPGLEVGLLNIRPRLTEFDIDSASRNIAQ